mmetsp:Transcript_28193/g.96029  ORF Transcript_28193/g.96029 Transcript_28193/m.96029 type:complete len:271 (-) Transcript_28193:299-1111(-)
MTPCGASLRSLWSPAAHTNRAYASPAPATSSVTRPDGSQRYQASPLQSPSPRPAASAADHGWSSGRTGAPLTVIRIGLGPPRSASTPGRGKRPLSGGRYTLERNSLSPLTLKGASSSAMSPPSVLASTPAPPSFRFSLPRMMAVPVAFPSSNSKGLIMSLLRCGMGVDSSTQKGEPYDSSCSPSMSCAITRSLFPVSSSGVPSASNASVVSCMGCSLSLFFASRASFMTRPVLATTMRVGPPPAGACLLYRRASSPQWCRKASKPTPKSE